jgi:hypothetical protein
MDDGNEDWFSTGIPFTARVRDAPGPIPDQTALRTNL